MEDNIKASDKSLSLVKTIFTVIMIVSVIFGVIFGTYYFIVASSVKNYGQYIIKGFACLAGIPCAGIIVYALSMFFVWIAFDIKLMRNKTCGIDESQPLREFAENNKQSENSQPTTSEKSPSLIKTVFMLLLFLCIVGGAVLALTSFIQAYGVNDCGQYIAKGFIYLLGIPCVGIIFYVISKCFH